MVDKGDEFIAKNCTLLLIIVVVANIGSEIPTFLIPFGKKLTSSQLAQRAESQHSIINLSIRDVFIRMLGKEISRQLNIDMEVVLMWVSIVSFRTALESPRDVVDFVGLLLFDLDAIDDPKSPRFILRCHN